MGDIKQNRIQSFAFVISVCMAVCLSCIFILYHTKLESFASKNKFELESRINPNNASAASLVRLPDIGMLRAGAIVAYRQKFRESNGENRVFKDIDDLQNVRGIGPKTVQYISEHALGHAHFCPCLLGKIDT